MRNLEKSIDAVEASSRPAGVCDLPPLSSAITSCRDENAFCTVGVSPRRSRLNALQSTHVYGLGREFVSLTSGSQALCLEIRAAITDRNAA
jgi:hypothetical protein